MSGLEETRPSMAVLGPRPLAPLLMRRWPHRAEGYMFVVLLLKVVWTEKFPGLRIPRRRWTHSSELWKRHIWLVITIRLMWSVTAHILKMQDVSLLSNLRYTCDPRCCLDNAAGAAGRRFWDQPWRHLKYIARVFRRTLAKIPKTCCSSNHDQEEKWYPMQDEMNGHPGQWVKEQSC